MSTEIYLTPKNQPKRITRQHLASYKRARKEGLSANEAYNTTVLGISSLQFAWVREAQRATCGICPELLDLAKINQWFKDPGYVLDGDGRYLTYQGKTVSVVIR